MSAINHTEYTELPKYIDPAPHADPTYPGPADHNKRRRRSSSIISHVEPETIEELSDQKSLPNLNANWVNTKGAWIIHIVIIGLLKVFYDLIPTVSQELSWTLTNLTYVIGSYIMFHYVTGVPFEFNAGAFDSLTMWEQIDDGDQYTPAKKFLLGVPIGLFLVSTHYSRYDLTMFIINCVACLIVVLPKLPSSHRLRIVLSDDGEDYE
ncbi:hypothetical protein DV451_002177 [Geotrichum candidum]|uniref:Similar to Saccharomyces cerevisiae YGR038W ORM1 Evolutionarily conserved protein, similar to Orm2p,required for resistance to agents that induce unfolded protein response n=1 Tax=Geotrichum candidum TaxID=1173061 RepID=A0A0J9X8P4_GEOCN|nr:hypothetical protein DV451_002177 [Geotrichum candidum]KAI9213114.1 hypothetical protein DS838_001988 [Geotrichum bryndzae]KAF5111055.1 hypothetical protein DV453_000296 [Geotrichum candidum]KAF5116544.1 hypothetical protein DV454_001581 [Geotrichum candidum]KAF5124681.1 hypothetical protein DV452_000063 [Geotrichum candidum]